VIVEQTGGRHVLCPQSVSLGANQFVAAHKITNLVLDRLFRSLPRDADGELIEASEVIYAETLGSGDYMNLHVEHASVLRGNKMEILQSWFFMCPICGFVLPAADITDKRS
jgi:hypothetical protein